MLTLSSLKPTSSESTKTFQFSKNKEPSNKIDCQPQLGSSSSPSWMLWRI